MDDKSPQGENREFSRVKAHPRARLELPGGEEILTALVLDVSLGGMLVEGGCDIDLNTEVVVTIMLGEDPVEFVIDAVGRVARSDARGIAVEFIELESPESLEHLRNLILYNSTVPKPIEDEFRRHSGISRKTDTLS